MPNHEDCQLQILDGPNVIYFREKCEIRIDNQKLDDRTISSLLSAAILSPHEKILDQS